MSFIEYFKENFYEKLKTPTGNNPVRDRSDSMLMVFELLENKCHAFNGINGQKTKIIPAFIFVVETGTVRNEHGGFNFGGDGCSTVLFDEYFKFKNDLSCKFISVDINEKNCEYAAGVTKYDNTIISVSDSVRFINELVQHGCVDKIDLLYLDSYDVEAGNHYPSSAHHLMELCAAMPLLKTGSIVVVDDFDAFFDGGKTGKGVYVKQYMEKIGAKILFEGYQIVFEMP